MTYLNDEIEQRVTILAVQAASAINETWRGKDDACDRIDQAAVDIAYEVYGDDSDDYVEDIRQKIWSSL